MTDEFNCAVVEDVVLVTEVAEIVDESVLGFSKVIVTDFVSGDGAPTLIATAVITEEVLETAYARLSTNVAAGDDISVVLSLSVTEGVKATESLGYSFFELASEQVIVEAELESSIVYLIRESVLVTDETSAALAITEVVSDEIASTDGLVSSEIVLIQDTVVAADFAEEVPAFAIIEYVKAATVVQGTLVADISIADIVRASSAVLSSEQGSIVENLVLSTEVEAVSSFVLKDSARASEHLALGTAITQQTIERVSASEYLVGGDANMAEDWLTVVDIQQSTVRAQGQLRSEAIVQDQPVGEVNRGYSVHDQLAASEFLHIEISTPLEVLVIANDHTVLGFEAVAPETVGDTYASAEMTGQGVLLAQCLEALQATASAEFLVGTTNGVYEMLAAEYITVYDRVEVVEALDSFAWVLNSQSLAHSYYDGFVDFNSAVQLGNRAFMLSPSGLYELGGDSDDGKIIEAEVVTGQKDFGTIDRKRVEQFDLGYTAAGDLQAVVSCEGFDPSEPQTLEAREMRTAHTSRIRVGKGMVGRYWKLELKNREGADFELFSLQTKVALSTRRMR